jgi:hypothetical protein
MGYITGLQNNEINAAQADLAARSGVMDEIMKREGMTLNTLMGLRDPTSARINDYLSMGTGVLSPRNLTSAGNYSSPLDIRSAILDRNLAGIAELGMAGAMGTSTSAAGVGPSSYDGQFTPQFPGMTGADSYYGNSRPNAPDNFFKPLAAGSVDAASSGYQNMATGFSNLFQAGSDWWNNRNTSNDLDALFASNPSVYG